MWWSCARVSTHRNEKVLSDPSSIAAISDAILKAFMTGPMECIENHCDLIFVVLAEQHSSQMDKHLLSHSRDGL